MKTGKVLVILLLTLSCFSSCKNEMPVSSENNTQLAQQLPQQSTSSSPTFNYSNPPIPEDDLNQQKEPLKNWDLLTEDEKRTITIFNTLAPAVVNINTTAYRRDFWSRNIFEMPAGSGTGFIWDDQGHIVTNYHVIKDASKFTVILSNQESMEAELIGKAPEKDLAVLKLKSLNNNVLQPIPLGNSYDLFVGQTVLAIGNPFGLDHTLTKGIISALDREITTDVGVPVKEVIQTDAAINPGNSGGPLINYRGELIGVNTAILSKSGSSAGIGLAIPVDVVKTVIPQLIQYGKINRPELGVLFAQQSVMDRLNIKDGAMVWNLYDNSPADRAGLLAVRRNQYGQILYGDIITKIGDHPIHNYADTYTALEDLSNAKKIPIQFIRNGKRMQVTIEIP